MEYKKSRQNAKRVTSSAKEKTEEMRMTLSQNKIFRMAKQMVKKDRI